MKKFIRLCFSRYGNLCICEDGFSLRGTIRLDQERHVLAWVSGPSETGYGKTLLWRCCFSFGRWPNWFWPSVRIASVKHDGTFRDRNAFLVLHTWIMFLSIENCDIGKCERWVNIYIIYENTVKKYLWEYKQSKCEFDIGRNINCDDMKIHDIK